MAIPVHHTLRLEEVHSIPYNSEIYRNIGAPPRYHIYCTCQWEGWTHERDQAVRWIMGHKQAQEMRGNTVELVGIDTTPKAEAAGDPAVFASNSPESNSVADKKPSEADSEQGTLTIMREDNSVVELVQKVQFHPEQNLDGTKKQVGQ